MVDTPKSLPKPDIWKELGNPIRGADRMALAVLVDKYGAQTVLIAVEDIRASRAAIATAEEPGHE